MSSDPVLLPCSTCFLVFPRFSSVLLMLSGRSLALDTPIFPFFAVRHGPVSPILVTSWTAWTAFLCTRFFALIFRASLHVRTFLG